MIRKSVALRTLNHLNWQCTVLNTIAVHVDIGRIFNTRSFQDQDQHQEQDQPINQMKANILVTSRSTSDCASWQGKKQQQKCREKSRGPEAKML